MDGRAAGRRVGCVFCVRQDNAAAQLRILLVTRAGRGLGLGAARRRGRRLRHGRGLPALVLRPDDPLAAARHIYLAAGFRLVDEERSHSSARTWSARLRAGAVGVPRSLSRTVQP